MDQQMTFAALVPGCGKLRSEPDDLFDVLEEWRGRTRWSLQRAMAGLPPWLDLDLPLTQGMVDELVRRARAEGAYELDPGALDEDDAGEAAKTADALCASLVKALAAEFGGIDVARLSAVLSETLRADLPAILESGDDR